MWQGTRICAKRSFDRHSSCLSWRFFFAIFLRATVRKHPWTMTAGSKEGLGLSPPDEVTMVLTKLSFPKYFHTLSVTSSSPKSCKVGSSITLPLLQMKKSCELSWNLDPGFSSSKICAPSLILSCPPPLSALNWSQQHVAESTESWGLGCPGDQRWKQGGEMETFSTSNTGNKHTCTRTYGGHLELESLRSLLKFSLRTMCSVWIALQCPCPLKCCLQGECPWQMVVKNSRNLLIRKIKCESMYRTRVLVDFKCLQADCVLT